MNINDLFPKKWLEPADLLGRSVTVKIVAVGLEEVYDPRSRDMHMKLCLTFEKAQKRMLLNKTQAFAVVAVTGSEETDGWIGKSITLSGGQTQARRPTIVVAPPPAKPASAAPANVGVDPTAQADPPPLAPVEERDDGAGNDDDCDE